VEYPNWFIKGSANTYFARNLTPYVGQPMHCLQLGAYTGDATKWLFDNILTHPDARLTDVDTWGGSDEPAHKDLDWTSVEDVYLGKTKEYVDAGKLTVFKGTTDDFFQSEQGRRQFHFIYVDADHEAASVLKDGLNSFYRLADNGVLAFDDYMWTQGKGQWADPKPAVDAIVNCHSNKLDVLDTGLQVWIKKKPEQK
jgi:hypothetical protein